MSPWTRAFVSMWISLCLALALATAWPLPAAAQGGPPVSVNSADPASAAQGTLNLDVLVGGRGFGPGDRARFLVTGTADDTGGVIVNSTTVLDSRNLIANIDVDANATISLFDIEIQQANGGRGKGIELFAVQPGGGGPTCDLTQPSEFEAPVLFAGPELAAGARFGRRIAGRQVDFLVGGIADPILFAVSEEVQNGPDAGTGRLRLFTLDPGCTGPLCTPAAVSGSFPVGETDFIPTPGWITELRLADFDGNTVPDFVVATVDDEVETYLGHLGTGGELVYAALDVSPSGANFGASLAVADLDGDGVDELAVGATGKSKGGQVPAAVFIHELAAGAWSVDKTIPVSPDGDPCTVGQGFGFSVAFGDSTGDGVLDLIVGAPECKAGTQKGAGAVFVYSGPGFSGSPPAFVTGVSSKDNLGWAIATASAFDAPGEHDLVVATGFGSNDDRALVFPAFNADPGRGDVLRPSQDVNGWSTSGINVGDTNGDGEPDYLIGAPNSFCGNLSVGLGSAFLFESNDGSFDPPIVFLPTEDNDGDWNAFGWGTVILSGVDPDTQATSRFVVIGEPGRHVETETGEQVIGVGRIYIYRRQ